MKQDLDTGNGHTGPIGSFMWGLLCGAAVGAAVALWYAPKSGADLRRQVSDSAERLKRRATEAYDDASHAVSDVVAKSRRAFEVGREAYHSARPAEDATRSADTSH